MTVKFYWGEFDEIEYDYTLTNDEVKELKEVARKKLLDSLKGETIEEKAKTLLNDFDFESGTADDIIDGMLEIMLDDGDYDGLARELFEDSASDEYNEYHSYKDEYDYYGVCRSDF